MKKCLSLLLAVAAFATGFTLCSCGGGGNGANSYSVTAKEFANGSKSFYIAANNLWTLHSTGSTVGLSQSGLQDGMGAVTCWGEITTGSYDKPNAGRAKVLFSYRYDKDKEQGILEWSWDSADKNNEPTPALAYITSIHNLAGGGDEEEGNHKEMGGIGEEDDPLALAEHYGRARITFDFTLGTCVMSCPCGTYSQNLDFLVRTGN